MANALNKLEVQIQHNEADIHTRLPIEQKMTFMLGKHTDFDPVLSAFKELIEVERDKKLRNREDTYFLALKRINNFSC